MSALDKELEQLNTDIINDVNSLINKYVSITSWDIPENDEDEAKNRILNIIKKEIKNIEEK